MAARQIEREGRLPLPGVDGGKRAAIDLSHIGRRDQPEPDRAGLERAYLQIAEADAEEI